MKKMICFIMSMLIFSVSIRVCAAKDNTITSIDILKNEINGSKLEYSIDVKGDATDAYIVIALYDKNGILTAVNVNKTEGAFEVSTNGNYMLKTYAWEKNTMRPFIDSKTVYVSASMEMQCYLNNVLQGADGDTHYTYYLPANYDESKKYPMLVTLPGWSSLFNTINTTPLTENPYAQSNTEAWTKLCGDMIVVSPSLTDWYDKSARQTIELTEYFIANFAVDTNRIYAAGFSAGGETLSRAVSKRPELYAAYLQIASQWDGDYDSVASAKLPVYVFMGENDEYYGSDKAREAYNGLYASYKAAGMSDEEIEKLLVLDIRPNEYFNNHGLYNYHGGAYLASIDDEIINWMIHHPNY